ncbi:MAG: glycosyltransferase family 4 protein [Algicola sp.]|nr:glycosyltransferase family 4 protein [Algicola sp.]
MTIVHVNIGLGGGGAEHMILEMAKKSQQDTIKTIIFAITDNRQIEFKFAENNLEYHFLGINSPKQFFKGIKTLKRKLAGYDDVVMHCHMFHALIVGLTYSLFYKKTPIVFTLHNILVEEFYRRIVLYLTKPFRKADINFSSRASKWYLRNTKVIANGVDFDKFKLDKERQYNVNETFKFLYLGRIEEQKNPLILTALATKLLAHGHDNFEILVAGEGDMRLQLEQQITKHHLEKHIKLLGFQKDVKQLLMNAHCMIMPSLWEGLPISLIEASATKLPIITTPVGSIPDFFNTTNAYVADCDTFHKEMISVLTDYQQALAKAEKLYIDNKTIFDINSVYQQHLELYRAVSNEKQSDY